MNRGSPRRSCPGSDPARCFNEAPIHESGKFHAVPRLEFLCAASMRPRFMNRGSNTADRGATPKSGRFNEAPIHESGKSGPASGRWS